MPRGALEGLILDALKRQLMAPELAKAFIAAYHAELNRQAAEADLARETAARELAEVSRKLDGLIEAIADGFRAAGLQARLYDLERRKAELQKRLAASPKPAPRLHPNLSELYRRKVERLHEALEDPQTRDEALSLLRGLIACVTLRPVEGGFEIELEGEIANMIALPAGRQGGEALRRSVKVVAGARSHREPHFAVSV